jgi:AGZA family xanthine/uracil permease-like MFS transporter
VAEGARSGLASVVVAILFALAIFFVPVIALVGQTVQVGDASLHPAVAPALIIAGIPMTFSIAPFFAANWLEAQVF